MQNISIILVTLTTFTTRGQTENEKNEGSYMSISSEVPAPFELNNRNIVHSSLLQAVNSRRKGREEYAQGRLRFKKHNSVLFLFGWQLIWAFYLAVWKLRQK